LQFIYNHYIDSKNLEIVYYKVPLVHMVQERLCSLAPNIAAVKG